MIIIYSLRADDENLFTKCRFLMQSPRERIEKCVQRFKLTVTVEATKQQRLANYFDRARDEKWNYYYFQIAAFSKIVASDFGPIRLFDPHQKGFKCSPSMEISLWFNWLNKIYLLNGAFDLLLCNLSSWWWKASVWTQGLYLVVARSSSIIHVHVKAVYKNRRNQFTAPHVATHPF